ncbi:MAG TPA: hypothetical protein VF350_04215 [Candidatus Bathyarchaeia archaeon]
MIFVLGFILASDDLFLIVATIRGVQLQQQLQQQLLFTVFDLGWFF